MTSLSVSKNDLVKLTNFGWFNPRILLLYYQRNVLVDLT